MILIGSTDYFHHPRNEIHTLHGVWLTNIKYRRRFRTLINKLKTALTVFRFFSEWMNNYDAHYFPPVLNVCSRAVAAGYTHTVSSLLQYKIICHLSVYRWCRGVGGGGTVTVYCNCACVVRCCAVCSHISTHNEGRTGARAWQRCRHCLVKIKM